MTAGDPPTEAQTDTDTALAAHPFFSGLGELATTALRAASRRVELAAGETLVSEADPGDAAYLVLGGRFAVTVGGRLVAEASRGDLIGEMALLADEPRSATVTARRASVALRMDGPAFSRLIGEHPTLQRMVSAELVRRLRTANLGPAPGSRGRVLAVVTDQHTATRSFAESFRTALHRLGRNVAVLPVHSDGLHSAEITLCELDHDLVLLVPDPGDHRAVVAACDHADRVLLAVDGTGSPRSTMELQLPAVLPPVDLVLVHPPETDCPRGTHRWLAQLRPRAHHHVRRGDGAHLDRLARRMVGIPVGLVLSGGGARGLAHVGTYRAMVEHSVPIDVMAGTSAGSVFAVAIARGWTPDEVAVAAGRLLIDCGSPVDATLPTIALASGKRINQRIRDAFGDDDLRLEDLWIPTLLVSANLTTADTHNHLRGLAWRAVRASVAIPGVFPPMSEPEGLLVDGGLVDNLPVARLRAQHPEAFMITSDAGRRVEFPPDGFPADGEISGWSAWRLRRRSRADRRIPGVVGLLGRLTALGGAGNPVDHGEIHIAHQLPGVSMFDFAKGPSTMQAGYQLASEMLAHPDLTAARLAATTT